VYGTHRWDLDLGPDDACPLPYIILYKFVLLNKGCYSWPKADIFLNKSGDLRCIVKTAMG